MIPPPPAPAGTALPADDGGARRKGSKRSRCRRWAELLRRTFGLDPEICDRCGGPMKVIALATERDDIARYLSC